VSERQFRLLQEADLEINALRARLDEALGALALYHPPHDYPENYLCPGCTILGRALERTALSSARLPTPCQKGPPTMPQTIEKTGGAEEREGFEPSLPNAPSSEDRSASDPPLNPRSALIANPLPAHSAARLRGRVPCPYGPKCNCDYRACVRCDLPVFAHEANGVTDGWEHAGPCPTATPLPGTPEVEAGRPEAPGGSGAQPPSGYVCAGCRDTYRRRPGSGWTLTAHGVSPDGAPCINDPMRASCTCAALRVAAAACTAAGCGIAIQGPGCALHGWTAVRS
jgi:hypothetical protein